MNHRAIVEASGAVFLGNEQAVEKTPGGCKARQPMGVGGQNSLKTAESVPRLRSFDVCAAVNFVDRLLSWADN
ncbi:MAG TPA: hypothetical protein VMG12_19290, partial [Polyangiaceae bacterium]|nr:hypothetical protein [Polyangiaceae bacterium]